MCLPLLSVLLIPPPLLLSTACDIGGTIPFLQLGELKLRGVSLLPKVVKILKWESQELNSSLTNSGIML